VKERGAATIVAVAVAAGLVVVAAGLVDVSRLVAAQVQATAAADAAALAAAPLTFLGGDPTEEAMAFAARNGAGLRACRCPIDRSLDPRVVLVEVAKTIDLALLGSHTVRARAAAEFSPRDLLGP
jgi:hypothetical protein